MTSLSIDLMQLVPSYDDLLQLAAVRAGVLAPAEAPGTLREAGTVTDVASDVGGAVKGWFS